MELQVLNNQGKKSSTIKVDEHIFGLIPNKDAVYNADGNLNLTATENVLGQAVRYLGEYGLSKSPESFIS